MTRGAGTTYNDVWVVEPGLERLSGMNPPLVPPFSVSPVRLVILTAVLAVMTSGCTDVIGSQIDLCRNDKVGGIEVNPRSWTLNVGDSVNVKANVVNANGNWSLCMPVGDWASSDSSVAAVRQGVPFIEPVVVRGIRVGTAYIKATAQSKRDSLLVTVVAPR